MALNFSRIINTFVKKAPDGSEYVQMVDIAPHGFDEIKEEYRVNIMGKKASELLQSHKEYSGLLDHTKAYVGGVVMNSGVNELLPIDVSSYSKRTIVIYNHHDQPIIFRNCLFYVDFSGAYREVRQPLDNIEIPPFNTEDNVPGQLVIDESNYQEINKNLPGLGFDLRQSELAPTKGHLDIFVFGGV